MSTFLQKIGLSKTHKYESTLPLRDFTVEQILNIDPKDVGFNIREKEGSIRLNDEQSRALAFLLLLKEEEQQEPSKKEEHDTRVQMYLRREREVSNLIKNTQKQVQRDQKFESNIQSRLDALNPNYSDLKERHRKLNEPIAPVHEKSDKSQDEELQHYFEEGGRRRSRRRRSTKSKKKKTQHIKHFKSKKNKSIKKLQKRKTRVTCNK